VHLAAHAQPLDLSWIHVLEENGFYMVSGIATYCLKMQGWVSQESLAVSPQKIQFARQADEFLGEKQLGTIRPFQESDLPALSELSRICFGDPKDWLDKAHADPNLPKAKSDELYVRWLKNCCNGTRAERVLVAEAEGRPVGFIALRLVKGALQRAGIRVGDVELNAVDPQYRRRGIYSALVREGLRWFQPQTDWVTIKTQVLTLGVHKVWQRLGATLGHVEYYFHRFFESK